MSPATITGLLGERAQARPDHPQYTVIGRDRSSVLTLGAIERTAAAVAGSLTTRHGPGERAIVLTPSPAAFVAAFFGCCTAGMVPVPVAPPGRSRLARGLDPLRAVVEDCSPTTVITTAGIRDAVLASLGDDDRLARIPWVSVDELTTGSLPAPDHRAEPDDVAYLQYTSGSTAAPKGVEVTHRVVAANLANIVRAFELEASDHAMVWLPTHHDMGLVGGMFVTLHAGMRVTMATPEQFAQSPARWLRWISDSGATVSGGPDFAYRLCVDRIRDDQLDGIDLSRWRLAFTGAETIRSETLDAFADRFEPLGFDQRAFYPCYGLAEATLMVTGGRAGDPPRTVDVSRKALSERRAEPPTEDEDRRRLVSCGSPISPADEIAIVDPDAGGRLPEGEVGEIWYHGPSTARGYHGRGEFSSAVFGAALPDRPGTRWLRTGDLGFVRDGELYVTGRLREVIVVRGRNLDAADIDHALQHAVSGPRLGLIAALNPVVGESEQLVIAIEGGRAALAEADRLTDDVQTELANRFGVRADDVILVRPGSLPRTTSGKLRRAAATRTAETNSLDTALPSR